MLYSVRFVAFIASALTVSAAPATLSSTSTTTAGSTGVSSTSTEHGAYCCNSGCSAGGCTAFWSDTDTGDCIRGGTMQDIPGGHGRQCTGYEYCCATCSAGGCSAEWSSEDEHIPPDAGKCIKDGVKVPIPAHGTSCTARSNICTPYSQCGGQHWDGCTECPGEQVCKHRLDDEGNWDGFTSTCQLPLSEPVDKCSCYGSTWIEIDDGSGECKGTCGHCYDKTCIEHAKEAHWQHPLSECAKVGGQKPFCPKMPIG